MVCAGTSITVASYGNAPIALPPNNTELKTIESAVDLKNVLLMMSSHNERVLLDVGIIGIELFLVNL